MAGSTKKRVKQEDQPVPIEMATDEASLRPTFSNYVLMTRIQAEHGDDVTLTFMHIFPQPGAPGTDPAMRGETVARIQLSIEVAERLSDRLAEHLGRSKQEEKSGKGSNKGKRRGNPKG